ncbi:MAG TPA: 3-oxoacyl-[acyl-carrier-protein] synthase III C-terminal domain-containing protein [Actinomycetota bacterium]|nr:3-oxoacyl-[acyl-carrier-protein] synthase III C-terminal domain-containing protein [Actinomycetota bacterium]
MVAAVIAGLGSAVPTAVSQEQLWEGFFADHYRSSPVAERLWGRAGVDTRHGVAIPWKEDVSGWGTAARLERFVEEAVPLGRDALAACLDDAGLASDEVDALTVATCTGYATPGLDILLARELGLRPETQRLHVGHMGCYAALPALATLSDAAAARKMTGLLLCLELSSLHVQEDSHEVDQIIAHSLFADAAAAVAVRPIGPGLEVVDVAVHTDIESSGLMTWDVTDHGFRMGLGQEVPRVLERHVGPLVGSLLARHDLAPADVAGWAIHPGGPRILEAMAAPLGIGAEDVEVSRSVLRDYGNCSSPTVLLALQRLLEQRAPHDGDPVVCLAFGPGLTIYAALLRQG